MGKEILPQSAHMCTLHAQYSKFRRLRKQAVSAAFVYAANATTIVRTKGMNVTPHRRCSYYQDACCLPRTSEGLQATIIIRRTDEGPPAVVFVSTAARDAANMCKQQINHGSHGLKRDCR